MNSIPTVGVFDSGVGGLSILREIRRELPSAQLVYFADSKHAPYGDKPADDIVQRATASAEFLVTRGADAIVIACNTATEYAVDALRARHSIPVVGIEPAVKPATLRSRSGVIGVLATSQTLASAKYTQLIATQNGSVRVLSQACPGLVERVEAGDLDSSATQSIVARYVRPLVDQRADTIVLGCTHYPFLRDAIRAEAGPHIAILESAVPVARQLRRRLGDASFDVTASIWGSEEFWTTGDAARTGRVMSLLWGHPIAPRTLPEPWSSLPEQ